MTNDEPQENRPAPHRHIFQSFTDTRWRRSRLVMIVGGFILLSLTIVLVATMLSQAELTHVRIARSINSTESAKFIKKHDPVEKFRQSRRSVSTFLSRRERTPNYRGNDSDAIRAGFFVNWDAASFTSLSRHIGNMNAVFVEWSRLIPNRVDTVIFEADTNAVKLLAQHPEVNVHCMVSNYDETTQSWRGDILESHLRPEAARHRLVKTISNLARINHFYGINIDFEEVPAPLQPSLRQFLTELKTELHKFGAALSFDAPADDDNFDLKALSDATDYISLMAYDQHSSESEPGPISDIDWFIAQVDHALKSVPKEKLIVDLASYGYDWATEKNGQTHYGDETTFGQAVVTAKESDTTLSFDSATGAVHFTYSEDDGTRHDVWLNDAVTVYNQLSILDQYDIAGTAVWRLGAEDPTMWAIYGAVDRYAPTVLASLDTIRPTFEPEYQGEGELLNLVSEPRSGIRSIRYDPHDEYIDNEHYEQLPSGYILRRYGKDPKKVVLTFDDGPDPSWTPKILDVLAAKHAPAVFFVVGVNAQSNFSILKRIVSGRSRDRQSHLYSSEHRDHQSGSYYYRALAD